MVRRIVMVMATVGAVLPLVARVDAQRMPWNDPGAGHAVLQPLSTPQPPAPRRDLTGIWDAGRAGIFGNGHADKASPFTPEGQKRAAAIKPGNGPRAVEMAQVNDPLETMGDVSGFPRNILYELRPLQIVQTPHSVLILYMWEKRWRAIWTDGRTLPENPEPRWYGYSVGRWVDDTTFVVESNGTDERTWLDNAGNPHSAALRVEERYHRVNASVLELTVTIDDPVIYTKPWKAVDRLPLYLVPPNTDFMEMIPSASEAASVHKVLKDATAKSQ